MMGEITVACKIVLTKSLHNPDFATALKDAIYAISTLHGMRGVQDEKLILGQSERAKNHYRNLFQVCKKIERML